MTEKPKFGYWFLSCVCAAALTLGGAACSSVNDENKEEGQQEEDRFRFLEKRETAPGHAADTSESTDSELVEFKAKSRITLSPDELKRLENLQSIKTIEERRKELENDNTSHFYDDFIIANADEELPVSLIFNSAPLLDVLSAFADILGFDFIADNDIRKNITINLNSTMTRRDLWTAFEQILQLNDCGVLVDDGLLRITYLARLNRQPGLQSGNTSDGEVLLYPMRNMLSGEAYHQIRPFLSAGAVLCNLHRSNALLIGDTRENITKVTEILQLIDRNNDLEWPKTIIPCDEILPSKVVAELQEILPVLGFDVVKRTDRWEAPGSIQLIGLDRLRLIVACAANQEAVNVVKEWVKLLDTGDDVAQERVFVYKVRHNKAAHLAQALATIYDTQGASMSIDTATGRTRMENVTSQRARNNQLPTGTDLNVRNSRTHAANIDGPQTTDEESRVFRSQIKVFADGQLNRLVIRATPYTYASIKALLDRLDVVPAQVLLQVMVAEVTLSETTQFGLEFSGSGHGNDANTLFGTNYSNDLNPFAAAGAAGAAGTAGTFLTDSSRQNGATFVISDPNDPKEKFGYIRAMAGNNNVKVIASPQLLVSSHTEATINVGSSIPVITSGITNTSSSGSVQQNYTYKDAGVILTVTPQVTSTDLISIEIKQELSAVQRNTTSDTIDSPEFRTRTVETNMTIANGQTMIIGGMIQEEKEDALSSIPLINQIPILNRLFGSTDASVKRTEVLVMITGHIVNEHSPVDQMISRYNDSIKAFQEFHDDIASGAGGERKRGIMTKWEFWK